MRLTVRPTTPPALLLAAAVASLVAGCSSAPAPVEVVPAAGDGGSDCLALADVLPDELADLPRAPVTAGRSTAAWRRGDGPAVVLRCGVPAPPAYDGFATCQEVDGVAWFAPEDQVGDQTVDAVITTVETTTHVELTVPAGLRPPDAELVDASAAIAAVLPGEGC